MVESKYSIDHYDKGSVKYYNELAKKDGFDNYIDWLKWRKESGKMPDATKIDREQKDYYAKRRGYKDWNEYTRAIIDRDRERLNERVKRWNWDKGISNPMEKNKNCASYLGVHIFEGILTKIFEDPIRMPYGNPGFDWICKYGYKVQDKAACLIGGYYMYSIRHNNVPDYFLLGAFDDRERKNLLHLWLIHKDEIIRERKMWRRDTLCITNRLEYLFQFKKYEITDKLDKFNRYCSKLKQDILTKGDIICKKCNQDKEV